MELGCAHVLRRRRHMVRVVKNLIQTYLRLTFAYVVKNVTLDNNYMWQV